MCMTDCTILLDSEVLSLDTVLSLRTLSYLSVVICKLTSEPTGIHFIGPLAVCGCFLFLFVCLASHLIFFLPLWHIPFNVFNLASFPNQSHTPWADSSPGLLLLILSVSFPLYPSLDARACAVSVCRARHREQTLLVSKGRNRLMHGNHQLCKPGMHNTKEWCLEFGLNILLSSRTVQ